jgi:predicted transposase YdaD
MLGLDELKQTRFYQEIAEEEREEVLALAIPALLEAGLTVEQIATKLKTDVPTVERIVQQQQELQN